MLLHPMSAGFSVQPVEEMLPPGTETCWVAAPVGLDNPTLINIRNNDLMLSAHLRQRQFCFFILYIAVTT